MHYEVELAVVMANRIWDSAHFKQAMNAKEYEKAWNNAIEGYAIGNSMFAH